jgi:chitosanase
MPTTYLQKRTAQAIVNIFETGKALGDYGRVAFVASDPGQLTYGRSQTTLASGNLYLLIKSYCETAGAGHAAALAAYLPALADKDADLNTDMTLRDLLKAAGNDPVMRTCQDAFFDKGYWAPALESAEAWSLTDPLSVAVIYDSRIHGSWKAMRDRTLARLPNPAADPKAWTAAYVATRRDWLAHSPKPLLQKCVYRMDAFNDLIARGAWSLPLPLKVRGVSITEALLGGAPGAAVPAMAETSISAEDDNDRILRLTRPMMTGDDIRELQKALGITVDGVFGTDTQDAVKAFQKSRGLSVDGIVGPATMAALGL